MSLYNLLFGINPGAPVLLAALGLNSNKVPRLRDCYFAFDRIAVYTRTGGGNRDYYESEESCRANYPERFEDPNSCPDGPWNDDLRAHPCFDYDEDDDFDSTYATFYFRFPEEYEADLKASVLENVTHTPSEKWKALLDTLLTEGKI